MNNIISINSELIVTKFEEYINFILNSYNKFKLIFKPKKKDKIGMYGEVTNMVNIYKLKKEPCERWVKIFSSFSIINAHEAFIEYGAEYDWLYKYSNIDLIGWEIKNNCFDWRQYGWAVAKHCPEYFDSDKFNWKMHSRFVALFCPRYFDPKKYNWEEDSGYVAMSCPEHFDSNKYNWKKFSYEVAKFCPDKLDPNKYNWKDGSSYVAEYCPDKIVPELYNWEEYSWAIVEYCPDKIDPIRFNWEKCGDRIAKYYPEKLKLKPNNYSTDYKTNESYSNGYNTKKNTYKKMVIIDGRCYDIEPDGYIPALDYTLKK